MTLALSISIEDPAWTTEIPNLESMAEGTVITSLNIAKPAMLNNARPAQIGLLFADDTTLQALNYRFRRIDKPTNVLSFPANDIASVTGDMPLPVGDIAISFQTVSAEAACDGKTIQDHTCHMIVHGVLHLLGHDHEQENEADAMEALESKILSGLGVRNPYIV